MTTLIYWKSNDFILIASDTQVTSGHIRMPDPFTKILDVENSTTVIGGTGDIGLVQQSMNWAIKELKVSKIMAGAKEIYMGSEEISEALANLNFQLPLEYKHFSPHSFIVCGLDLSNRLKGFCVGSDGSNIPLESYYSDGSGQEVSLGLLSKYYNPTYDRDKVIRIIIKIFREACKTDVFTNNEIMIKMISDKGIEIVTAEENNEEISEETKN